MPTSRTKDYRFLLGGPSSLVEITNILGASISGDAEITNEAFLNQANEAASVHSVSESVSISSMFDSAATDMVVNTFLSSGDLSGVDASLMLVVFQTREGLVTWQGWPVSFGRPGFAAPPSDSITMPWELMQNGRGGFGTTVVALDLSDGTAATILGSSVSRPADPVLFLALTEVDSSVSEVSVEDGSAEVTPDHEISLTRHSLSSVSQSLTITLSGGGGKGWAFVGSAQALAADAS